MPDTLKQQIIKRLSLIKDRRQLNAVQRFLDKLESNPSGSQRTEHPIIKGQDMTGLIAKIDLDQLPSTNDEEGKNLRGLMEEAISLYSTD